MDLTCIQDELFVIEYLTKNPDEVSCVDYEENSILQIYAKPEFEKLQDFILNCFPEIVFSENIYGRNVLFDAIEHDNIYLVRRVVDIYPGSVLSTNDHGFSPLDMEISCYGCDSSTEILKTLLSCIDVNVVGLDFMFSKFRSAANYYCKGICILDTFPELYDHLDFDNDGTVLHVVSAYAYRHQTRLVRHIISVRPDLLLVRDSRGRLPAHVSITYETLSIMVRACPECITVQDDDGKTPLHHWKSFERIVTPISGRIFDPRKELDFMVKHPEVLYIRDHTGGTVPMNLISNDAAYEIIQMLVEIAPDSLVLQDESKKTCLHYCTTYKYTCWEAVARSIVRCHPHLLRAKDISGNTPMDLVYSRIGKYNLTTAKERFFATCLEFTSIEEEHWSVFSKPSLAMNYSFRDILSRSETDAARAFRYLTPRERYRIRAVLGLERYISKDLVRKILHIDGKDM